MRERVVVRLKERDGDRFVVYFETEARDPSREVTRDWGRSLILSAVRRSTATATGRLDSLGAEIRKEGTRTLRERRLELGDEVERVTTMTTTMTIAPAPK